MFGILKPTNGTWNCRLRNEWAGHFCGTCLALGDAFGQPARFATNYEAVLISALTDAQSAEPTPRTSHVCPLRGFRRLSVVAPSASGAQYAASVSMLMVATKMDDHAVDGDGFIGRFPTLFASLARRLRRATRRVARRLGFDIGEIVEAAAEQTGRESHSGRSFLFYSEPTERSVAAAFAHTAQIAERSENRAPLAEIGGLFGRLIFLLDSYRDLEDDRREGAFNALAASSEEGCEKPLAQRLFQEGYARIHQLLDELHLARPGLVRQLLVDELGAVGARTLGVAMEGSDPDEEERRKKDGGCWNACCCDGCCGCCDCGCDCCSACSRSGSRGGCCDGCCDCCDSCDCCSCDC